MYLIFEIMTYTRDASSMLNESFYLLQKQQKKISSFENTILF
jgi:hypothetical protein